MGDTEMMNSTIRPRHFGIRPLALVAAVTLVAAVKLAGAAHADDETWPSIRADLFASRAIAEDQTLVELEAPVRAEDAALVPITIKMAATKASKIKSLTLIVDKNPAPVAATFTFGPAAGDGERVISTRLRFDLYSSLRAVVELEDGTLHMATKFVKAAGGCSAPALKDADEAMANLGKVQVRMLAQSSSAPSAGALREGQVMVRHPNYSGMQMNQETGYYIPAKYVTQMNVSHGPELVFKMEAGISLSADPNIRFTYAMGGTGPLRVMTQDSDGNSFTGQSTDSGT
jgi:sulfur-oxidizing protein SoxY